MARIEHQLTAPYTPQQNEVSEKKNRTIMEMARGLMFKKNLPKKYWVKAAHTDGGMAREWSADPLEILVGPMTRAKAKRFKEAFMF